MYHTAPDSDTRLYCSNILSNIYDAKPSAPPPPPLYLQSYRGMREATERERVVLRSNVAVSLALSPFAASCTDPAELERVRTDVGIFLDVMQRTTGMVEMGMFGNVQEAVEKIRVRIVTLQ